MSDTWKAYAEKTEGRRPRELLVRAVGYVGEKGTALDFGAGALNESRYLLQEGFKSVVAVDKTPVAKTAAAQLLADRFTYRICSFDTFDFKADSYHLINAQYALPFNPTMTFDAMFAALIASLKQGGIVTGQMFGINDTWNNGSGDMTFHTREQAEKLLGGLEKISFDENEEDGSTAMGERKHWHIFHFIARKQ